MNIRAYETGDYESVVTILKEVSLFDKVWDSRENLAGMVATNPEAILIATNGEKVIGQIFTISYGPKVAYLFRLAVASKFRNQGVASQLIEAATTAARNNGAKEVGLYVNNYNEELLSFYTKRGFKVSKDSYFYMWKELS